MKKNDEKKSFWQTINPFPKFRQYQNWSKPAKLTFIGVLLAFVSIIYFFFSFLINSVRAEKMNLIINSEKNIFRLFQEENKEIRFELKSIGYELDEIEDLKIEIEIYKKEERNDIFTKLFPNELMDYFKFTKNLSNINAKNYLFLNIYPYYSGKYRLDLIFQSNEHEILKKNQIYLNIRRFNHSFFEDININKNIFLADIEEYPNDSLLLLDICPKEFSTYREFKIIFMNEVENTNVIKSTCWFVWQPAVVASGYPYFDVNLFKGSVDRFSGLEYWADLIKQKEYINEASASNNNQNFEKIGIFSEYDKILVPIGSSLYLLERIDYCRLKFTKISENQCKIHNVRKISESNDEFRITLYESSDLGIEIETRSDFGATGRHLRYYYSISTPNEEYSYVTGSGGEIDWYYEFSDFPVFILFDKENKKYIKIESSQIIKEFPSLKEINN